jgi:hypothetical protein
VSVLRHDYAYHAFAHAVDGEVVTQFDPTSPADRRGTDPDRLLPRMTDVGLTGAEHGGHISRSLRLVEQLTGALPTFEALTGPLISAHIEPWFSAARKPAAARPDSDEPVDAVPEVRRLAGLHGLTDTPGLAEALAAAERGETVSVTPDSPLGHQVRTWLTESQRATWSMNDHNARHRMTDEERRTAFSLGWLTRALGAALQGDPTPTP